MFEDVHNLRLHIHLLVYFLPSFSLHIFSFCITRFSHLFFPLMSLLHSCALAFSPPSHRTPSLSLSTCLPVSLHPSPLSFHLSPSLSPSIPSLFLSPLSLSLSLSISLPLS